MNSTEILLRKKIAVENAKKTSPSILTELKHEAVTPETQKAFSGMRALLEVDLSAVQAVT